MKSAPVWLSMHFVNAWSGLREDRDEKAIVLVVPISELFVFTYFGGNNLHWECVLQNRPCADLTGSLPLKSDRADVRASWKTLLHDLPGPAECQAIVDRLEPEWYRGTVDIADMMDVANVAELIEQHGILDTMGMYPSAEDCA